MSTLHTGTTENNPWKPKNTRMNVNDWEQGITISGAMVSVLVSHAEVSGSSPVGSSEIVMDIMQVNLTRKSM